MHRVTEPELMLGAEQAQAYSDADYSEAHDAAVARFVEAFGDLGTGRVLDLACGPADTTVRFARALGAATFLGVDGSPAMLALGLERIRDAGLGARIELAEVVLPSDALARRGPFDAVVCTSALHHFHDPAVLWTTVRECAAPGAAVFVQDLARPGSTSVARGFVDGHGPDVPEVLRHDYFVSLLAAFTTDEVRAQLDDAGLTDVSVEQVTDRHLVAMGRTPDV